MALYVRNPWDSGSLVVADPFAAGELIITTATRGNLPYGPQYTHTMTVEDTVAGESATRTFSFLPPAGYEAGPVIPSTFLTTPDSIGSAFVGAVDEGDQLKLPNTYTSGGTPYSITWELDGSGNYTGRIASIDGPADQTLTGELWRLNGTPNWASFAIELSVVTDITGTMAVVETGPDTFLAAGSSVVGGSMSVTEAGEDVISAAGDVPITGSLTVVEAGTDVFSGAGDSDGPPEEVPPDPYSLGGPRLNAVAGNTYSSDEVVITGGPPGAVFTVAVTGGQYSIDGAAPTSAAGTMQAGQSVRVFVDAPADPFTAAQVELSVGGMVGIFIVVTGSGDLTGVGVQFFVRDAVTKELITNTTIDLRIDSQQFGGYVMQEYDDLPIDSSGFMVVPMTSGQVGRQVFVSGELADGKRIQGTTGIMDFS